MTATGGCVVVTGGAGALGTAVVRELAARGYFVAIVDSPRAENHAKEVAAAAGEKAFAIGIDVSSREAWADAVAAIEKRAPIVGAALIAGGWAGGNPLAEDADDHAWRAMMSANADTVYESIHALLPSMISRKNGSIVVIGSRAVERPWTSKNAAAYAASKSAAVALARTVAEENREAGIRVNAILPSTIDTQANRKSMPNADASKWVKPESLAKVIAFLISDDARDVSGAVIPVYGRA